MEQLNFLGFLVLCLVNFQLSSGLFDATLTRVSMIDPNDLSSFDATGLRVKKVNRTQHSISGTIDLKVEAGDQYVFLTEVYQMSGNTFKKMPYKVGPLPFCQYVNKESYFIDGFRKVSNFPPIGTCPWPKGLYTINGFIMDLERVPLVFSTGEYKLVGKIMLDDKIINGLEVHGRLQNIM